MKITIDTKEDSKEELKKLIRMLSAIVDDNDFRTNNDMPSGDGLFNLFSDNSSPNPSPVFDTPLNENEKKKELEELEQYQIVPY